MSDDHRPDAVLGGHGQIRVTPDLIPEIAGRHAQTEASLGGLRDDIHRVPSGYLLYLQCHTDRGVLLTALAQRDQQIAALQQERDAMQRRAEAAEQDMHAAEQEVAALRQQLQTARQRIEELRNRERERLANAYKLPMDLRGQRIRSAAIEAYDAALNEFTAIVTVASRSKQKRSGPPARGEGMSKKPTVNRCALRGHHEGPHVWIETRRIGQFGECRTLAGESEGNSQKSEGNSFKRFWLSWIQPTVDYRPLTDPPQADVLGWWCSGSDADDWPIMCALVQATDLWNAKANIATSWPEMTPDGPWRIETSKPSGWLPGDRFPMKPWMVERINA